jgi:hypothetical protein
MLGLLQMTGAAFSLGLIAQSGLTALSLTSAMVTGLFTVTSVLLFGARPGSGKAPLNGKRK